MRWMLFLLLFILLVATTPQVNAAVIYGGKLFHGQNFTTNIGGHFRIYGTNPYTILDNTTGIKEHRYAKAIITSDVDTSISIFNNTCEETYQYKYCYLDSYLDLDNPNTYKNGYTEAMFSISVETLPPPTTLIEITRNTTLASYCGQLVTVPVGIYNTGSVATNITYSETLPLNTLVTNAEGGDVDGNTVTFKGRLQANASINYSFTITNFDCLEKTWNIKYSFTTYNSTIYRNITDVGIVMLPVYNITDNISASKTNFPSDKIIYTLNLTNNHPTLDLYVDFNIDGDGLTPVVSANGISSGKTYNYKNYVPPGQKLNMFIMFTAKNYSTYNIRNVGTLKVSDRKFDYKSTNTVTVAVPTVVPYLEVTDIKNDSLNVDVYIRNDDLTEKYYYIYGLLNGFRESEEPVYYNSIDSDSSAKISSKVFNITKISGKNNITFDGVYRDKNSIEHKISAYRTIDINSGKIIVEEIVNTTKPPVIVNITTPVVTKPVETPKENTTTTAPVKPKKDFITSILEGLSQFLQALFG